MSDTTKQKSPSDIDCLVGRNVRAARLRAGLTLADLSEKLGISYQQFQKYETGQNRISVGRIHAIAAILDASVSEIFASDGQSAPDVFCDPLYEDKCEIVRKILKTDNQATLVAVSSLIDALSKVTR